MITSEGMYQTCLNLDPFNEESNFNFAKSLKQQKNFDKAGECFLGCKTATACVNHHYAVLLMKKIIKYGSIQGLRLMI